MRRGNPGSDAFVDQCSGRERSGSRAPGRRKAAEGRRVRGGRRALCEAPLDGGRARLSGLTSPITASSTKSPRRPAGVLDQPGGSHFGLSRRTRECPGRDDSGSGSGLLNQRASATGEGLMGFGRAAVHPLWARGGSPRANGPPAWMFLASEPCSPRTRANQSSDRKRCDHPGSRPASVSWPRSRRRPSRAERRRPRTEQAARGARCRTARCSRTPWRCRAPSRRRRR